jgi:MFS family permease
MLLWSGLAVSVLGSRISSLAYPLLVLALTGSPGQAGLVGFFATLPYLVFQLHAGALVDRWNRKRVMIWCDVGRAAAVGTVVVAIAADAITVPHLAAAAFVEGALFVFFDLAEAAAVKAVVPRPQLPAALSQNEARQRGASLLGQPLGGFLYEVGRIVPFVVDALSYLVSLVTLLLIRKDFQEERTEPRTRIHREIAEGIGWLWRQPFLRDTAFLVAGSNLMFQALVLVLIVRAKEIGASPGTIGIMLAGVGLGGLAGSLAASWVQRHVPAKTIVIGANWVWAALMPLLALFGSPWLLGATWCLMGFVGPMWNVVIGAYSLWITPDRLLARVQAAGTLVAWGAIPLGSLAGGLLLETLSTRTAIAVLSAWMLLLAVASLASRGIRAAPSLDEAQAASAAARA